MAKGIPTVAIVGRTNVGKSSLFNAIAKERIAIVEDSPGVTRDRNYMIVSNVPTPFTMVDTGGLLGEEGSLAESIQEQTHLAIQESDLILGIFDGVQGVHPYDHDVVNLLRRSGKPVVWVVNKCEKSLTRVSASEFYGLGLDEVHFVSAAHQIGVKDLVSALCSRLEGEGFSKRNLEATSGIRVAIVGKPNVGKSTLINRILGKDRLVTSDKPGTTTDSIDVELKREGEEFVLIDTAGLRRRRSVHASVEWISHLRTISALSRCDVAVLLLDATMGPPTAEDAKIAGLVHERGRGLVVAVNKWDVIEKDQHSANQFREAVHEAFKFAAYAPVLFVSALTGQRCAQILRKAGEVHAKAKTRVDLSAFTEVLREGLSTNPAPLYRGEAIKVISVSQIGVSPPTFALYMNHPKVIHFSYERYMKNVIRKHYDFEGSDIRLELKKVGVRGAARGEHI